MFFDIDRRYVSLAGLFGPLDNVNSNGTSMTIVGDGRTLATLATLEAQASSPIQPFTVDVTGVTQLEFRFNSSSSRFALANLTLSSQGTATASVDQPIGNFNSVAMLGRDIRAFRLNDVRAFTQAEPGVMMGVEYEHGFAVLNTTRAGSVFFNINGHYTTMTGLMGPLDNVNSNATTLTIIGDGRTLETLEIRRDDPTRPFSVNVSGVTQFEFRFNSSSSRFAVADVTL